MVPNSLPAPKTLKLDGSPVMGTPSQATYTIPLAILNIPNVAIKGAIPPYAMMKPLIAPQVKPAAMAIRIAMGILTSVSYTHLPYSFCLPISRSIVVYHFT